jgi:hypothetical protein
MSRRRVCLIGFDPPEIEELRSRIPAAIIAHSTLPKYRVQKGQLHVDSESGAWLLPVDLVVFNGIFEDDYDFLLALNIWGGPCFPNPQGMLDCRLRHTCLVRALRVTKFPGHGRGFVPAGQSIDCDVDTIAKWGNWHCGENKHRFIGVWRAEESATLEPYFSGKSVRIVLLNDEAMQIELAGEDWKHSIHHNDAHFTPLDVDLVEDSRHIARHLNLDILGNDYIVTQTGERYLLEVNHIPNVTRFPELWKRYSDLVIGWVNARLV